MMVLGKRSFFFLFFFGVPPGGLDGLGMNALVLVVAPGYK